jgi:hypothetical protein
MHVEVRPLGHAPLTIHMPFEDFLAGPVMSHLAAVSNDSHPADVLRDYLSQEIDVQDDDEFRQGVEEACMLACNDLPPHLDPVEALNVRQVWLEDDDLPSARTMLLPNYGLRLVEPELLPAA